MSEASDVRVTISSTEAENPEDSASEFKPVLDLDSCFTMTFENPYMEENGNTIWKPFPGSVSCSSDTGMSVTCEKIGDF